MHPPGGWTGGSTGQYSLDLFLRAQLSTRTCDRPVPGPAKAVLARRTSACDHMDGLRPSPRAELPVERATHKLRSIKISSKRSYTLNTPLIKEAGGVNNPAVVAHSNQIQQLIFNRPAQILPWDRFSRPPDATDEGASSSRRVHARWQKADGPEPCLPYSNPPLIERIRGLLLASRDSHRR
jgi:hypothetical protein